MCTVEKKILFCPPFPPTGKNTQRHVTVRRDCEDL